ncbi:slit homolog 1 protein-like [Ruditapes philippinarum]|uniref:slit homolog 1 protein-like n=1 Tax=Ruditapes philippinarum TaxID=129788 RepID=UPI00295AE9D2|nr:slit homolog 1 protein-like [Ruditapes philippinarum]
MSDQAPSDTEVYKIEHQDADMTEIPSNLCNWDTESSLQDKYPDEFQNIKPFWGKIVKIKFENNKIKRLPNINCLVRLDEMNLRNNQLQHVSNTSFTNLRNLRSILMSGNQITEIDPNILISQSLSYLFHVDFSKNVMSKLDVSNMFTLYPFCNIDYSSNEITDLVNEGDFTMDIEKSYGPGYVGVSNNKLSTWPDFQTLFRLDDITQLGRLIYFGFDFRGMSLVCDCNVQQFLEKAYNIINALWRSYMNLTCSEPASLAGHLVWDIYKKEPEKFVCPVEDGCDPRCTCVDEPKKNTSFIDCSNSDLKWLPGIPYSRFSYFVALNVSNNQISTIGNVSYLHRISILDISRNNLKEINTIANHLDNATYIDISNNPRLRQLPQMFQYHNVCSRHMKNLQISCDCQSKWIEKWVHSRSCNEFQDYFFQCEIPKIGIRRAVDFNPEDLECSPEGFLFYFEIIIAGVILSLVLIGILVYTFRYELLILCLRMRQKSRNIVVPLNEYDVFLSFNDADDDVDGWVNSILVPELTNAGYSVFQPNRDVAFGSERDSEIIDILSKTHNFLTIMSESYIQESEDGMRSWTENEWKYGWNNFKSDRSKNIVLVNFDYLSSFDVNQPQIKAFLRVGCTVDFKNYDRKIMQQIFEKLGKPCRIPSLAVKTFDNKKVNFNK